MEPAKKMLVNTLAQHVRSVLNICLSLYSTRLVLQALGQSDFGIYSLIAGVVAMLGFLTNAMVITTQRQLSFWYGKGNVADVQRMFSNSLFLHIIAALLLGFILIAIKPLLFNGFLNIEATRIDIAVEVYLLVILTLIITFLTAPFRALFIARENIIYISIVDVLDGVIKLGAAIWLLFCPFDRLIAYSWIIVGIMSLNLLALTAWAKFHFEEVLLFPRKEHINKRDLQELTGFAGWTIYSIGCIIGRTQGVAIIFNIFFGTIINAAYGIAQQVYGSVQFIAQSIINAMSPQIVKAEGQSNRQRTLFLGETLSKYAFLLLAVVVIPLVFEMAPILRLWLGEVPEYAVVLCQYTLIASLCDQTTIGLGTVNQAIGRIRNYSLTINTLKLLTFPAIWINLRLGYTVETAMIIFVIFECLCAAGRLPFIKYTAGLSIRHFCVHVFGRILIPLLSILFICYIIVTFIHIPFRFFLTGCSAVATAGITVWFFGLDRVEKEKILNIVQRNNNYHERNH